MYEILFCMLEILCIFAFDFQVENAVQKYEEKSN